MESDQQSKKAVIISARIGDQRSKEPASSLIRSAPVGITDASDAATEDIRLLMFPAEPRGLPLKPF